jgi:hypothetical protein
MITEEAIDKDIEKAVWWAVSIRYPVWNSVRDSVEGSVRDSVWSSVGESVEIDGGNSVTQELKERSL